MSSFTTLKEFNSQQDEEGKFGTIHEIVSDVSSSNYIYNGILQLNVKRSICLKAQR